MSRWDVPDHPVIVACERTGYPPGMEPKAYTCPICGQETDTFLKNDLGEIVGCPECIRSVDAWEEYEDEAY